MVLAALLLVLILGYIVIKALGIGLYYDIPPCPECGSRRTGRYLRSSFFETENMKILEEGILCGEVVDLTTDPQKKHTAFCRDCGHEWHYEARASVIGKTERDRQRRERFSEKEIEEARLTFGERFMDARQRAKEKSFIKRTIPFSDLTAEAYGRMKGGGRKKERPAGDWEEEEAPSGYEEEFEEELLEEDNEEVLPEQEEEKE